MNIVKVKHRVNCTHATCTQWPTEFDKPDHNTLRREPTVIASILTTRFDKVDKQYQLGNTGFFSGFATFSHDSIFAPPFQPPKNTEAIFTPLMNRLQTHEQASERLFSVGYELTLKWSNCETSIYRVRTNLD